MHHEITAAQMLDAFKQDVPGHAAGTRWAHTHGLGVLGHFMASEVAKDFCVAEHFQGSAVPVTARFSNGSSDPVRHDQRPDTRGLAVKFHYADGTDHDLLSMTLSVFGARTREEFLGVSKAFVPKPVKPESWFRRHMLDPLDAAKPSAASARRGDDQRRSRPRAVRRLARVRPGLHHRGGPFAGAGELGPHCVPCRAYLRRRRPGRRAATRALFMAAGRRCVPGPARRNCRQGHRFPDRRDAGSPGAVRRPIHAEDGDRRPGRRRGRSVHGRGP